MKVSLTITQGLNCLNESGADYHVHKEGCRDIAKVDPRGWDSWLVEIENDLVGELLEEINSFGDFEMPFTEDHIKVFNCAKQIRWNELTGKSL